MNRIPLTLTLSALGVTALGAPAFASRAGITGRTESGCATAGCHGGGALEPTVTFEGPSTVAPGATATFSLILSGTQPGARSPAAGFNIGATGGTLAPADAQLKAVVAELVQNNMPIPFDGETVKVSFNWTAPSEPGEFTLAGAGNSVNGDFVPTGDASAVTTHVVTVSADAPPVGGSAGGAEPPAGGDVAGGSEPPTGGASTTGGTPATGADAGPSGGAPSTDDTSDSSGCQAAPGRGAPASALLALLALPLLRRRRR